MDVSSRAATTTLAVTHGLRSEGVVLAAENEADYGAHLKGTIEAFSPIGHAETHAVARLADLTWRQDRWMRALDAQARQVEERLKRTPEHAQAAALANALTAVGVLLETMAASQPRASDALDVFLAACRGTLALTRVALSTPSRSPSRLERAIEILDRAEDRSSVEEAWAELRESAESLRRALRRRAREAERALEEVRQELAATALPSIGDAKLLDKYRRMIDGAVESQLRIIGQLRDARSFPAATGTSASGEVPPPTEVRLRIVR